MVQKQEVDVQDSVIPIVRLKKYLMYRETTMPTKVMTLVIVKRGERRQVSLWTGS